MTRYLRSYPPAKCPSCSSTEIFLPDQPAVHIEVGAGYDLEIDLASDKASPSFAEKVVDDFESGKLSDHEVLGQYERTENLHGEVIYQCKKCSANFRKLESFSYRYEYYSAFWRRLKRLTSDALEDTLGVDLDEVESFTESWNICPTIVERLHAAKPSKYKSLKSLKDLSVRLPAEKGGGELIISTVLLSLFSAILYDIVKGGGAYLLTRIRIALRNRQMDKIVSEALETNELSWMVDTLSDRELIKLLQGSYRKNLSDSKKKRLIKIALNRRGRILRKQLIEAARLKGRTAPRNKSLKATP